jgi:hypothetical protein
MYPPIGEFRSAQAATECQSVSAADYFWPLERERIWSAWQQGNFAEARIWLTAHQSRQKSLYTLAGHLNLAVNGQIDDVLKQLRDGWLKSRSLLVESGELQRWNTLVAERLPQKPTPNSNALQAWELVWLIELALRRHNFSIAFQHFYQVLERLLFLQCHQGQWLQKRHIEPHPNYRGNLQDYTPGLGGLILGWEKFKRSRPNDPFIRQLNAIRLLRNDVAHTGQAVTEQKLQSLFGMETTLLRAMLDLLAVVSPIPQPAQLLLKEIGQWGLKALHEERAIAIL